MHRDLKPDQRDGQRERIGQGARLRSGQVVGGRRACQRRPTARLRRSRGKTGARTKGDCRDGLAACRQSRAEGRPVDGRSDIFSFGAVLYEMITGRKAFRGDTRLLDAVGHPARRADERQPDRADARQGARALLARCLRKDAGRRFQHMADVKVALEELKGGIRVGSGSPRLPGRSLTRVAQWQRRLIWAGGLLSVLVVVAALTVWFRRTNVTEPSNGSHGGPRSPRARDLKTGQASRRTGTQVAFSWNGESRGQPGYLRQTRRSRPAAASADECNRGERLDSGLVTRWALHRVPACAARRTKLWCCWSRQPVVRAHRRRWSESLPT